MKEYTARNGKIQFKPSIEELEDMDENNEGFCVGCGDIVPGVEPDVSKALCEVCEQHKVYGASELALMGLCY